MGRVIRGAARTRVGRAVIRGIQRVRGRAGQRAGGAGGQGAAE